jgi:histidyl-tRNA synthetase
LRDRGCAWADYYTRTTFEFVPDGSGADTERLLGGGRYDGLSEMLGGPKARESASPLGRPAILTLQAQVKEAEAKLDAFIAPMEFRRTGALKLAQDLRAAGIEVGDGGFRLKKSFEAADKLARKMVIFGEDEERAAF